MVSVASARTAGAVGRELMDTRYSAGKVASERREIHCKPSIRYSNDVPFPMFFPRLSLIEHCSRGNTSPGETREGRESTRITRISGTLSRNGAP